MKPVCLQRICSDELLKRNAPLILLLVKPMKSLVSLDDIHSVHAL